MKEQKIEKKSRVKKISTNELVECYKYYFQNLSLKELRRQITALQKLTEKHVYNCRNTYKRKHTQNDLIYIDFIEGAYYPELMVKYSLSRRGIVKAISETRKDMIDGIKKDVADGFLKYDNIEVIRQDVRKGLRNNKLTI